MENGFSSHAHSFCVRFSRTCLRTRNTCQHSAFKPDCGWVIVVAVVVVAAAVVVDVGCPLSLPSLLLSPLWRVLATTAFRYHIHKHTLTSSLDFSRCVCLWKWTFSCYRETFTVIRRTFDKFSHTHPLAALAVCVFPFVCLYELISSFNYSGEMSPRKKR